MTRQQRFVQQRYILISCLIFVLANCDQPSEKQNLNNSKNSYTNSKDIKRTYIDDDGDNDNNKQGQFGKEKNSIQMERYSSSRRMNSIDGNVDSSNNYSTDILDQLDERCEPMNCRFNCCDQDGNCPMRETDCYFYKCENSMCSDGGCCIKGVCRTEKDCKKGRTYRYIIIAIVAIFFLIFMILKQQMERFFKERQWYNSNSEFSNNNSDGFKRNDNLNNQQFILAQSYQTEQQVVVKGLSQQQMPINRNFNSQKKRAEINLADKSQQQPQQHHNNNLKINHQQNNSNSLNIREGNNEVEQQTNNNILPKNNRKFYNSDLKREEDEEESCNVGESPKQPMQFNDNNEEINNNNNLFFNIKNNDRTQRRDVELEPVLQSLKPSFMSISNNNANLLPSGVSELYKSKFI